MMEGVGVPSEPTASRPVPSWHALGFRVQLTPGPLGATLVTTRSHSLTGCFWGSCCVSSTADSGPLPCEL